MRIPRLLSFVILLGSCFLQAQNDSLFSDLSFEQAKFYAKRENKLILVEGRGSDQLGSLSWDDMLSTHPPSLEQLLDKYIVLRTSLDELPLSTVGREINSSSSYLLFFSSSGELLHFQYPFFAALLNTRSEILAELLSVLDPNNQFYPMRDRYEAGERDLDFMINFSKLDRYELSKYENFNAELIAVARENEYSETELLKLLFNTSNFIHTDAGLNLILELEELEKHFTTDEIQHKIKTLCWYSHRVALLQKNPKLYSEVLNIATQYIPDPFFISTIKLNWAIQNEQFEDLPKQLQSVLSFPKSSNMYFNQNVHFVRTAYSLMEQGKIHLGDEVLRACASELESYIERCPRYSAYELYAKLLYAIGSYDEAYKALCSYDRLVFNTDRPNFIGSDLIFAIKAARKEKNLIEAEKRRQEYNERDKK